MADSSEIITWHPPDPPPNDTRDVLIRMAGNPHKKVWPGYHNADGWFSADGYRNRVAAWCEMPEGPK